MPNTPSPITPTVEHEVVRRIDAAAVCPIPFPHILIDGIFPATFYAELLRQIPSQEFYTPISDTGAEGQRLVLHLARLDALPAVRRIFWLKAASWLIGSNLASAFAKKFAPVIEENAGRDPRELAYGVEAMLVKYSGGYQIGPHTGPRNHAISALFHLPPNDNDEQHGTALYAPYAPGFCSDGRAPLSLKEFGKIATVPFRPNSMFGFARSGSSFHGMEPVTDHIPERDALLYTLSWRPLP